MQLTYILPIKRHRRGIDAELTDYLQALSGHASVIVVDGSPAQVFAAHAAAWSSFVVHVPVDPDAVTPNGKVGAVLTGVRRAAHERLIIADDDVRYDAHGLARMAALLESADVVRPQNYFDPLPWHARWDSARSLLNRLFGGDWPGTLGVRRSVLAAAGGYAGDVLFENLELVRTVQAAGGNELAAPDLFIRRLPPSTRHFWSQRVRQAYDEFARPARLGVQLGILPVTLRLAASGNWPALALGAAGLVVAAEAGRRRANGRAVFPWTAALLAPAWVAERAVCSWLACWQRLAHGGIRYNGRVLCQAATPERILRRRHGALTPQLPWVT